MYLLLPFTSNCYEGNWTVLLHLRAMEMRVSLDCSQIISHVFLRSINPWLTAGTQWIPVVLVLRRLSPSPGWSSSRTDY